MTREALGLFLHTRKIAQRHTLAQPQRQRDGRLGDGNILKDNVLDLIARLVKARDLDRGGIVPAAVMVQHLGGQGQPLKEAVYGTLCSMTRGVMQSRTVTPRT